MNRTSLAIFLGLPAACVVGWSMGGALGAGAVCGFCAGAVLGGISLAWLAHTVRTRPDGALGAFVAGFAAKLGVLLAAALVLRYVEPAAARVDYRSFLLAFTVAICLLLVVGLPDATRARKERTS